MKKLTALVLSLVCLCLIGCTSNTSDSETKIETSPADYGKVIELARAEFSEIFKEAENLKIEGISTMTRNNDANEVIVQIKYSTSNGNGVYGFLYSFDDNANPNLIQHGEDIAIDDLLK